MRYLPDPTDPKLLAEHLCTPDHGFTRRQTVGHPFAALVRRHENEHRRDDVELNHAHGEPRLL